MPRSHRPSSLARWLLLIAVPTVALGIAQLDRTIDPSNAAMKVPGTGAAAATAAVQAAFGSEYTLLLALADRAGLPLDARQQDQLEQLQHDLVNCPGVTAVTAQPSPAADLALVTVQLADRSVEKANAVLAAAASGCPPTTSLHATGLPLFEAALAHAVAAERDRMVPLITGVLLLLSWFLSGRLRLAVALLLPALAAIAWTGGLLSLLGRQLDPIAVLLEPVLMTVGVAAAVHFALAFERSRSRGHAAAFAAAFAARSMRLPALLATATTMVGFLTLAFNPMPAVARFGIHAAFGTALAHAFCFALLPAALQLTGRPPARSSRSCSTPFTAWLHRRGRIWLGGVAVALALAMIGLRQLHVDNDPLQLLAREHPFRIDHQYIVDRLGGVDTFDLLVPRDSPAQAPERLLPFVAASLAAGGIAGLAGPPQRARDGTVRLPLRLAPGGSNVRQQLFTGLRERAELLDLRGLVPAGGLVQMADDSQVLIRGQLLGMLATCACLLGCLAIGFRSLRSGLLAMLPTAMPCVLLYGGMGLCGHPISVATAMIGSVLLGLVVDNTIHFMHHFRQANVRLPRRPAVRQTLAVVGRPLWISCAVLATGFASGLFSTMSSTVEFGALAGLGIAISLLANAVVLPAALLTGPAGGSRIQR